MPSTAVAEPFAADTHLAQLLVKWQQPSTRALRPVGVLSFDGEVYRFSYLSSVHDLAGFRPLMGFPDLDKKYESAALFTLFKERVLDPSRPDYARYVTELDLDPERATPWELLTRSGGESAGDTLQLQPFPRKTSAGWGCRAMVAGVRHLALKEVDLGSTRSGRYSAEGLERLLSDLHAGDELHVTREIGNTWDPAAALLVTPTGDAIGYLPNWLARLVEPFTRSDSGRCHAHVERVNPLDAGWHLRVLFDLEVDEPFEAAYQRLMHGEVLR
ncbi:hypothetical protein QSU92_07690 [Microbacterium sp. ET2]|uniref:HIRAN domain-containing protein n=1 Tax=Microbacterium albipurpureum TaxID=3050384 RepID=UPI00259CE35F|nr:HIRAN domain-containing protein [Microbacterium sp. ET2 (Ac-2212)]WJL97038.1 hypothetical protein QSU92_07690 [Microbacterium sp. ET2 (Ac-2212)]